MKVILTVTVSSETRDEAMAWFLETGGRPPQESRCSGTGPSSISARGILAGERGCSIVDGIRPWLE